MIKPEHSTECSGLLVFMLIKNQLLVTAFRAWDRKRECTSTVTPLADHPSGETFIPELLSLFCTDHAIFDCLLNGFLVGSLERFSDLFGLHIAEQIL
jgi:hypothetical protein